MSKDENGNGQSVSIPLPFGGQISARGSLVVIVLMIIALGYITLATNADRALEHRMLMQANNDQTDKIISVMNYQACLTKLNLFVITSKDPTHINVGSMPPEIWNCLPKFLTEEQQEERKKREREK